MTLGMLGTVSLLGLGLALTGCGYSCEDFCEDEADCPGSDTNPEDCGPSCEVVERVNEDFGCDDEFDELMDCAGGLDDICDDDEAEECADEAGDWAGCIGDYCTDHPSNDDC